MAASKNTGIINLSDIIGIWRLIAKNWYIPIISVAVFFGAGYIYAYKLTDVFAARTQILIKSQNDVNASSIINEGFGSYGTGQTYVDNTNETRVIRSYDLVKAALDRLDLNVSYFLVGRIKTVEVFTGMPFRVKVLNINPALFEQEMKFKILDENSFRINYLKYGKEESRIGYFDKEFTEADFRFVVYKSGSFLGSSNAGLKLIAGVCIQL